MTKEQSDGDDSWNALKEDIDEWFEINPEYLDRKVITDGLFSIGDTQTEYRKMHWATIVGVFSDLSNKPTLVVKHEQNERARRSAVAKKGWETRKSSPQWKERERRKELVEKHRRRWKEEGEKYRREWVDPVTCCNCRKLFVNCRCGYFEPYWLF